MRDCRDVYRPASTTGGVVDQLVVTRGALDECSVKVACVRAWRAKTDPGYVQPDHRLECADPERPEQTVVAATDRPVIAKPKPKVQAKAATPITPDTKRKVNPKRRAPMPPISDAEIKRSRPGG